MVLILIYYKFTHYFNYITCHDFQNNLTRFDQYERNNFQLKLMFILYQARYIDGYMINNAQVHTRYTAKVYVRARVWHSYIL